MTHDPRPPRAPELEITVYIHNYTLYLLLSTHRGMETGRRPPQPHRGFGRGRTPHSSRRPSVPLEPDRAPGTVHTARGRRRRQRRQRQHRWRRGRVGVQGAPQEQLQWRHGGRGAPRRRAEWWQRRVDTIEHDGTRHPSGARASRPRQRQRGRGRRGWAGLLLRHAPCWRVPAPLEVPGWGWDHSTRCGAAHAAQRGRDGVPRGGRAQGQTAGIGLASGLIAERQGGWERVVVDAEAKGEGPEAKGGAGPGRRARGRGARGRARGCRQATKGADESVAEPRGAAHPVGLSRGAPSSAAVPRCAGPRCVLHLHSLMRRHTSHRLPFTSGPWRRASRMCAHCYFQ